MKQNQSSSVVEVRQKAQGNRHVEAVDEGECNLFVHFSESVIDGTGANQTTVSDVHEFVGMAVVTADLSHRRTERHGSGWDVVLKKE